MIKINNYSSLFFSILLYCFLFCPTASFSFLSCCFHIFSFFSFFLLYSPFFSPWYYRHQWLYWFVCTLPKPSEELCSNRIQSLWGGSFSVTTAQPSPRSLHLNRRREEKNEKEWKTGSEKKKFIHQFIKGNNNLVAHVQNRMTWFLLRMMTEVVPSPTSSSCALESSIILLAAGWDTSTSRRIQLPSFVITMPPCKSEAIQYIITITITVITVVIIVVIVIIAVINITVVIIIIVIRIIVTSSIIIYRYNVTSTSNCSVYWRQKYVLVLHEKSKESRLL